MNSFYKAYEAVTYNGQRSRIVTESMLEQGGYDDLKLLVVPHVVSTTPGALEGIRRFIENGGSVITMGECFIHDTYANKFQNEDTLEYIKANARHIDGKESENGINFEPEKELGAVFWDVMSSLGLCKFELIDADTGLRAGNIEWSYTDYEGGTLLNLCLYDWSKDRNISIKKDGKVLTGLLELRSGEELRSSFQAKKYTPMLIKIAQ